MTHETYNPFSTPFTAREASPPCAVDDWKQLFLRATSVIAKPDEGLHQNNKDKLNILRGPSVQIIVR